jgi:hypothetical protein
VLRAASPELATIFTFCFNEIGQPYITAQDTAVNRINSLLQFKKKMNIKRLLQKEQLFFLLSSLLLNASKIKRNGCAFKTLTLNWLIPLKEVYNNRDSFPSLEHYTQQLHTTKSLLL